MTQLTLFDVVNIPAIKQVHVPIKVQHDPYKGFRVIVASGLTHATRNPCAACQHRGEATCSAVTATCSSRESYLATIGYGRPSADTDEAYGFGFQARG